MNDQVKEHFIKLLALVSELDLQPTEKNTVLLDMLQARFTELKKYV